ncbi:hypothetical protein [Polyangium spumosum]|uniref:Outer membrane beta-barrel protein n=1 Tax=Polyangium spumosum TaxID=889282 RepID=A0A6N7Q2A6_9BACT|nr:hypothetical protein [Polyangium spumosum]MRG98592.1 hypothetical protein [Polyangium spumosum]
MRRAYADLLTLALVMLAPPAMADDAPAAPRVAFRLEYAAPPGAKCPASSALAELTSAKFRYDAFPDAARASLSVTVRRAAGRLEAALVARDDQGAIQWEETATPRWKCDELVEDVALMIYARFMTPKGETPEAWTLLVSPSPPVVPETPKAPPPPVAPAPEPPLAAPLPQLRQRSRDELAPFLDVPAPPDNAPPFRTELSAAFVVAPLDTPGVALGGAFQVALRWPWFSLGVELRGVVDHRGDLDDVPVRTWLATGSALPCLVIRERGRVCAPIAGGFYQVALDDTLEVRTDAAQPFGGVGLRGSYDLPLSQHVALRGYAEVLFKLRGANAEYTSTASPAARILWTTPGLLPSVGIGVTWNP